MNEVDYSDLPWNKTHNRL